MVKLGMDNTGFLSWGSVWTESVSRSKGTSSTFMRNQEHIGIKRTPVFPLTIRTWFPLTSGEVWRPCRSCPSNASHRVCITKPGKSALCCLNLKRSHWTRHDISWLWSKRGVCCLGDSIFTKYASCLPACLDSSCGEPCRDGLLNLDTTKLVASHMHLHFKCYRADASMAKGRLTGEICTWFQKSTEILQGHFTYMSNWSGVVC